MDFVWKLYGNTYAVHVTVALVGVATLNLALPAPLDLKGGNLEKLRFFLIFAEKCANWILILQINVVYGPTGVWVQNAMQFWLTHLSMKNNHEALQTIPVVYPYPLEFDNLRFTQMRPIPDWLPKSIGGGGGGEEINGANVVIIAICSWYWYILSFEKHFSPANHLKLIITGSLKG